MASTPINSIFTNHPSAGIVAATPASLISYLLPNIMAAAGIIFFLMILGGGFMMVKNAGGSPSAQDTAKAKSAITMGIIGFLLVVSAYFILQIVQALTGVNFIITPIF
ncbi:MAG: hypothetical protein AAB909_03840 [Patescibacteria group bacterium]